MKANHIWISDSEFEFKKIRCTIQLVIVQKLTILFHFMCKKCALLVPIDILKFIYKTIHI